MKTSFCFSGQSTWEEVSYRCILLYTRKCWKCVFQHTPTFIIEPIFFEDKSPTRENMNKNDCVNAHLFLLR